MKGTYYLIVGGLVTLVYTLHYYFSRRKILKSAEIFSAQILDLEEEIVPAFGQKGKTMDEKFCVLSLYIPSEKVNIKLRTDIHKIAKLKGEYYVNVCRLQTETSQGGIKKAAVFCLESDLKKLPLWLALIVCVISLACFIGGFAEIITTISEAVGSVI
jgi:hypothetical protein